MDSFGVVMVWMAIGWFVGDKLYKSIKKSKGEC